MGKFAEGTKVSITGSIDEIRSVVRRFGADNFSYGESQLFGLVAFSAAGRHVRFRVDLPNPDAPRFKKARINQHTDALRDRAPDEAHKLWTQACAESWRALALLVKAKLAAIDAKITTFEEEFLGHIVMPSGETVYEMAKPNVAIAYDSGRIPRNLLEAPPKAGGAS